ncbi:MAG: glycosyltransferase [Pseudomonadota bacterium]|nr:glycosyltransferase [Pseudomonadota bacterium]
MASVAICICTLEREALLGECLDSLQGMDLPEGVKPQVVIIDNDARQTSRALVASRQSRFPVPLHYECEPRRGIPCARNRAIEVAHGLAADYIVFVDDDERVEPNWLAELYHYCMVKGGQAVIHGAVESALPPATPPHIRSLYNKKKRNTGDRLNACATNNVIVPIRLTREMGLRFDESNPLAGGTDTIFFATAAARGVEIYECTEALVKETIPESRTTLRWWMKRKYRAGVTDAWRKQQNGRSRLGIFVSAALQVIIEALKALVALMVAHKEARTRFWLKSCRAMGVCMGLFGVKVDSYSKVDC